MVRGARYSGKARILRRLQLGVREFAWKSKMPRRPAPRSRRCSAGWRSSPSGRWTRSPPSARAMKARASRSHRWVWRGMEERYNRVEQIEHRVRMLLGVFGAYGVLPLEFKPAYTVGDLLVQHLDDLEQEAESKGGVQQVLDEHFAKVYKVRPMSRCLIRGCFAHMLPEAWQITAREVIQRAVANLLWLSLVKR